MVLLHREVRNGAEIPKKADFAFACVAMMGHLMPLVPYMHELIKRGHNVTLFCGNDSTYPER